MAKKTTSEAQLRPTRAAKRTPGIAIRSGLRGGDTEKTTTTTTSTTGTAGTTGTTGTTTTAVPNLIIIR